MREVQPIVDSIKFFTNGCRAHRRIVRELQKHGGYIVDLRINKERKEPKVLWSGVTIEGEPQIRLSFGLAPSWS